MKPKRRADSEVYGLSPPEPYTPGEALPHLGDARSIVPRDPGVEIMGHRIEPEELEHLRGKSLGRPMGEAFAARVQEMERKLDAGEDLSAEEIRYLAQRTALGLLDAPRTSVRIQAAKLLTDTASKKLQNAPPKNPAIARAREILE